METQDARITSIKDWAAKYEDLSLPDKGKLLAYIRKDIEEQIEKSEEALKQKHKQENDELAKVKELVKEKKKVGRKSKVAPGKLSALFKTKRGRKTDTPEKVLEFIKKKGEPVTAAEVQKQLKISYLTANKTLKNLVKAKTLREVGKQGKAVLYRD